jgi:nitrogen regulatory protein PII
MKKIEAIIKPHELDTDREALIKAGGVFVSSLDDVVRVRTGEHGERAL